MAKERPALNDAKDYHWWHESAHVFDAVKRALFLLIIGYGVYIMADPLARDEFLERSYVAMAAPEGRALAKEGLALNRRVRYTLLRLKRNKATPEAAARELKVMEFHYEALAEKVKDARLDGAVKDSLLDFVHSSRVKLTQRLQPPRPVNKATR